MALFLPIRARHEFAHESTQMPVLQRFLFVLITVTVTTSVLFSPGLPAGQQGGQSAPLEAHRISAVDYFRGDEEVRRVQEWRRAHPGYWKKQKSRSQRDQPPDSQGVSPSRDLVTYLPVISVRYKISASREDPAFVGLISMVTGSTLQEDIATTARQLLLRGREHPGPENPGATIIHNNVLL